jgi:hypothetical protein
MTLANERKLDIEKDHVPSLSCKKCAITTTTVVAVGGLQINTLEDTLAITHATRTAIAFAALVSGFFKHLSAEMTVNHDIIKIDPTQRWNIKI